MNIIARIVGAVRQRIAHRAAPLPEDPFGEPQSERDEAKQFLPFPSLPQSP